MSAKRAKSLRVLFITISNSPILDGYSREKKKRFIIELEHELRTTKFMHPTDARQAPKHAQPVLFRQRKREVLSRTVGCDSHGHASNQRHTLFATNVLTIAHPPTLSSIFSVEFGASAFVECQNWPKKAFDSGIAKQRCRTLLAGSTLRLPAFISNTHTHLTLLYLPLTF